MGRPFQEPPIQHPISPGMVFARGAPRSCCRTRVDRVLAVQPILVAMNSIAAFHKKIDAAFMRHGNVHGNVFTRHLRHSS
jgi:hypothetical protein